MQAQAERSYDLEDRGERRVSIRRQGFVKTFSAEPGFKCDLRHAFGSGSNWVQARIKGDSFVRTDLRGRPRTGILDFTGTLARFENDRQGGWSLPVMTGKMKLSQNSEPGRHRSTIGACRSFPRPHPDPLPE